jgi:hypothetical protein
VPGFIFAWIAIYVVSLMGAEPAKHIQDTFNEVDTEMKALHDQIA